MRWIEACLQRCSVAYKCVPSRLPVWLCLPDCLLSHSHTSPSHTFYLILLFLLLPRSFLLSMYIYTYMHANHSFGLGFMSGVTLWKQTDRHTLTRMSKKNWRFIRFCVVDFIWNTKIFSIHLSMLFHLRMGNIYQPKKNRLLWFQLKKNELKFDFFSHLCWMCVCVHVHAKRWVIDEDQEDEERWVSVRTNGRRKSYFYFHISY